MALRGVKTSDITDRDTRDYLDVRHGIAKGFKTEIATHNLPNLLDVMNDGKGNIVRSEPHASGCAVPPPTPAPTEGGAALQLGGRF